jgi:hypothetical protein
MVTTVAGTLKLNRVALHPICGLVLTLEAIPKSVFPKVPAEAPQGGVKVGLGVKLGVGVGVKVDVSVNRIPVFVGVAVIVEVAVEVGVLVAVGVAVGGPQKEAKIESCQLLPYWTAGKEAGKLPMVTEAAVKATQETPALLL